MTRSWKKQTGTFTVRRVDDGEEFELIEISTFREIPDLSGVRVAKDRLKDVASPDGRSVYTTNEKDFFFEDEPDRPMRIPDDNG